MSVLKTNVNPRSDEAKANAEAMSGLIADLEEKVARVKLGGGDTARERHVGRGKAVAQG